MKEKHQIAHMEREVESLIQRFRMEYSISVASAIGVLYLAMHKIATQALEQDDDDAEPSV